MALEALGEFGQGVNSDILLIMDEVNKALAVW